MIKKPKLILPLNKSVTPESNIQINESDLPAIYALRDWFLSTYHSKNTEGFRGELFDCQKQVSNDIIKYVVCPKPPIEGEPAPELFIEFSRQSGKTTTIVHTVEFLIIFFRKLTGRQIRIGIFAPQREQAKTDFDRLKESLEQVADDFNLIFAESNSNTLNVNDRGYVYVFPVSETSHPESKTLDLILFEEAHLVNERKMKYSVFPMGASTNAPRVFIGTAGTSICYFYRGLNDPNNKVYEYDYEYQIKERRIRYEQTKDPFYLNYENYIKGEIDRLGYDSDDFKAAYRLIWILGTGQFTTKEALYQLMSSDVKFHATDEYLNKDDKGKEKEIKLDAYVGIDTAKDPDSTVVTVLLHNRVKNIKWLAYWLELKGENYVDQFYMIESIILGIQRDEKNQIILGADSYPIHKGGFNVRAIAIDSTGQGDFMPDMFEKNTEFDSEFNGLYRVKFSLVSKDIMYKNLNISIRNRLTLIPEDANILINGESINLEHEKKKFIQQMIDLQKEYKGQLLSVHHPKDDKAHDDYPDSWALSEFAFAKYNELPEARIT